MKNVARKQTTWILLAMVRLLAGWRRWLFGNCVACRDSFAYCVGGFTKNNLIFEKGPPSVAITAVPPAHNRVSLGDRWDG
jgi:hypothetical protein